jgi:hypothetical protein
MNPEQQNQEIKRNLPNCLRCRVDMEPVMRMPVRTGGISGFFSEWGEFTEKLLVLDTYRCPRCRKLEFFDFDQSLPHS